MYKDKKFQILSLFFLVYGFFIAGISPCQVFADSHKLSLSGSSTIAPLLTQIAERYEKEEPEVRIDVQTGGSSRGIADVIRGLSDIGMSSRALYPKESEQVKSHTIAMDGVAFVVNTKNPLSDITKDQARKIYMGQLTNWKELGGIDGDITVIDRAKGRSEKELIAKFLDLSAAKFKVDAVAGENQQCVKLIEGNVNAIVYLSIGTAAFEAKRGSNLKLLSFEGVVASPQNVRNRSFPLVRPLVLLTTKSLSENGKMFLHYALSNKVSDLIEGQAFVSVGKDY